jgi:hypothetical protein
MRNVADRLDTLAREATGSVAVLAPELAVRARRRHRMRVAVGAVAAACVAAGSLYAAVSAQSGPARVVRVAAPPGTASPSTTEQGAQPPAAGVFAELAGIAERTGAQYGDPSPRTAEAVATNLADFETAVHPGSGPVGEPFVGVYFVQMTGQFTCGPGCFNISSHTPKGTVLSLAVDQTTLAVSAAALTNQPVNMAPLGTVHHLDLRAATAIGPSLATSTGVVEVPTVDGMSQAAAGALLANVGLVANFHTASSTVFPPGDVVATMPPSGSLVEVGSSISVTVSSGPSPTSTP